MTLRLAPADEDAIATAAEQRASARRQLDAEALVAARLAELRALRLTAQKLDAIDRSPPLQLAGGGALRWERDYSTVDPDGWPGRRCLVLRQVLASGSVGVVLAEVAARRSRRDWCARIWNGGLRGSCGPWVPAASVEEAMVWVEQQIA